MNNRTQKSTTFLAVSLSLGLLLGAGQAVAANGAQDHSRHAESNKPVSDSWITTKVKTELLAAKNVPGTEVKVETVNGKVTLTGTVKDQAEHDKAVAVAKAVKGVKDVDASQLNVNTAARN